MHYTFITFLLMVLSLQIATGQTEFRTRSDEAVLQASVDSLERKLLAEGFQNIAATVNTDVLYVTFENRRYRDEVAAVRRLSELVAAQPNFRAYTVDFTLQNRSIPTVTGQIQQEYSSDGGLLSVPSDIRFADYKTWKKRFAQEPQNKGNWRIEFEFEPQLLLALGAARDPILHQINLLPSTNLYLWRGGHVRIQGIIPISDELKNPEDQFWRPRLLTLSQYIPLPRQMMLSATVGYFTERRYGGAVQLSKFFGKKSQFLLQANAAYTGFASFPQVIDVDTPTRGWQFSAFNYFNYSIAAEYIIPKWNMRTRLAYQKTLLNKQVIRAEVWRQFDELQLGFFLYRFD
ncbi:MAG: YjbH domain-containing protein, partial [Bacteroidota bacterium]